MNEESDMNNQTRTYLIAGAVALIAAVAVGVVLLNSSEAPPSTTPGITGAITTLQRATDGTISMLVEGGEQPPGAVSDKAMVTVDDKTKVYDQQGDRVEASVLAVGQNVDVWFTGPVAESYPVQGGAAYVQLK
jgi:hypothetical protein